MPFKNRISKKFVYSLLALSFFATSSLHGPSKDAFAMSGSIGGSIKRSLFKTKKKSSSPKQARSSHEVLSKRSLAKGGHSARKGKGKTLLAKSGKKGARGRREKAAPIVVVHTPPLESLSDSLSTATLKPGLVHKMYRGRLHVNVVEVDLKNKDLAVRPYLASDYFNKLKTTEEHAKESGALVAVNANYFKKDGTPLGTLLMDGEWIAGSIFNRVAMGITESRDVKFDRVDVHGILNTSNPDIPSLWVNTVNQPRRSGAHLILYTQRWGSHVKIPYDGCLVAVSNTGEVIGTDARNLYIPNGGFVLCDKKDSKLAKLKRSDHVFLSWKTNPSNWADVVQSVSGGPTLIRDGKLLVDVQDEKFGKSFSTAKVSRRTACGVTADKKMIIITVEGQHNIYNLAKLMLKLGCVDAMNLDGGGSTSMVVMGKTVTQNRSSQRRVAASLVVMDTEAARALVKTPNRNYVPKQEIADFEGEEPALSMEPFKARSVFLTENDVTRDLTCASNNFTQDVVAMEMGLKSNVPETELLAGLAQNLITINNGQAEKNATLLELKPSKRSRKMLRLHQKVESKFLLPFRFGRPKS
ncbi:MAG: phosphodiester glycosidase family protein [Candidatus Melainabacteria bacterium]|nr:phosphodiester glycosidase family protein [Candidatus Melainabacteria bacterium]